MAKKRSAPRTRKGPSAIPPGFRTVTPYLSLEGGVKAVAFYVKAFGARRISEVLSPDGRLVHGRIRVGDSIVMMSDVLEGSRTASPARLGSSTVTLHVYSKNVDALWARAVAAGAKVAMPLENQFWGERYGQLIDPFGHHWSLSMRVKMSRAEQDKMRRSAMAAFANDEHPDSA